MAIPKKLSRGDVYKQIDAFRGISNRNPGGKSSAEQWVESKRAAKESGGQKYQRSAALAGKSAVGSSTFSVK
jgi:hypothetical protein